MASLLDMFIVYLGGALVVVLWTGVSVGYSDEPFDWLWGEVKSNFIGAVLWPLVVLAFIPLIVGVFFGALARRHKRSR